MARSTGLLGAALPLTFLLIAAGWGAAGEAAAGEPPPVDTKLAWVDIPLEDVPVDADASDAFRKERATLEEKIGGLVALRVQTDGIDSDVFIVGKLGAIGVAVRGGTAAAALLVPGADLAGILSGLTATREAAKVPDLGASGYWTGDIQRLRPETTAHAIYYIAGAIIGGALGGAGGAILGPEAILPGIGLGVDIGTELSDIFYRDWLEDYCEAQGLVAGEDNHCTEPPPPVEGGDGGTGGEPDDGDTDDDGGGQTTSPDGGFTSGGSGGGGGGASGGGGGSGGGDGLSLPDDDDPVDEDLDPPGETEGEDEEDDGDDDDSTGDDDDDDDDKE